MTNEKAPDQPWRANPIDAPRNVTVPRAQYDAIEKLYHNAMDMLKKEQEVHESVRIGMTNKISELQLVIDRINGITRDHTNGAR